MWKCGGKNAENPKNQVRNENKLTGSCWTTCSRAKRICCASCADWHSWRPIEALVCCLQCAELHFDLLQVSWLHGILMYFAELVCAICQANDLLFEAALQSPTVVALLIDVLTNICTCSCVLLYLNR